MIVVSVRIFCVRNLTSMSWNCTAPRSLHIAWKIRLQEEQQLIRPGAVQEPSFG